MGVRGCRLHRHHAAAPRRRGRYTRPRRARVLPAYLVMEPHAATGDDVRLLALLVGTNVGPMVLLWGSLATLLWRERLRAPGSRRVGTAVRGLRAGRRAARP